MLNKVSKTYCYISGCKGGIGKSLFSVILADYKSVNGSVLLIDTDPTNPDSSACYKNGKEANVRTLRTKILFEDSSGQSDCSGLIETINLAEAENSETIIVDAPAGDSMLLMNAGKLIIDACQQAQMRSVFIWMIDSHDRTPVNALHAAWPSISKADLILLVKNCRKGTNFDYFDNSKIMESIIAAKNVKSIDLPKIASRIEEHLRIDRMTWSEIATKTPLGNRVEGARLRQVFHETLTQAGL